MVPILYLVDLRPSLGTEVLDARLHIKFTSKQYPVSPDLINNSDRILVSYWNHLNVQFWSSKEIRDNIFTVTQKMLKWFATCTGNNSEIRWTKYGYQGKKFVWPIGNYVFVIIKYFYCIVKIIHKYFQVLRMNGGGIRNLEIIAESQIILSNWGNFAFKWLNYSNHYIFFAKLKNCFTNLRIL